MSRCANYPYSNFPRLWVCAQLSHTRPGSFFDSKQRERSGLAICPIQGTSDRTSHAAPWKLAKLCEGDGDNQGGLFIHRAAFGSDAPIWSKMNHQREGADSFSVLARNCSDSGDGKTSMLSRTEKKYKKENNEKETPQELIVRSILTKNSIPFIKQKVVHHPTGFYLLDFMIRKPYRIALEIDGWQHLTTRVDYDVKRSLFLELEEGFKVIRFRNDEVNNSLEFEKCLLDTLEKNKIFNRPLTQKELLVYRRKETVLRNIPIWRNRFMLTKIYV